MKKYIQYSVVGIIFLAVLIGYFKIKKNENTKISTTIEAVPLDASFIIEIKNTPKNLKKIIINSPLKYIQDQSVSDFLNKINDFDSLLNSNDTIKKFFGKDILISAHQSSDVTEFLLVAKISKTKYLKNFSQYIEETADSIKNQTYSNVNIYEAHFDSNIVYFAYIQNLAIFSYSVELEKSAIRQVQSKNPITLDLGFKNINDLSSDDVRIFVNYYNLKWFVSPFLSSKYKKKDKLVENLALWSAFKISTDTNNISLSGFTSVSEDFDNFFSIFEGIKPQRFEAENLIPYKTAEFISLNISDFAQYNSNYQKFVNSKNLTSSYKQTADDFFNRFKIQIIPSFVPLIDDNVIFAKCNFNKTTNEISNFLLIKTNDISEFSKYMTKLNDTIFTIDIDDSKKINVNKIKSSAFLDVLFGQICNFPQLLYFTTYDNYFIFGESADGIKQYYLQLYRNKTLGENEDFQKFKKKLSSKSDFLYYINNFFNYQNESRLLNEKYRKIFNKNLNFFKKWQFIAIQFSYTKENLFETFLNMQYNDNPAYNGLTLWETELSNKLKEKPMIFINHYTYEKEIFLIDTANHIYLFNNKGKKIWEAKIDKKIIGQPYMVDLYRNKKYQILLCLEDYLTAIDRNGNIVKEKTVKLPGIPELGISVIDYDKNQKYRFFVPIQKQVYVYDNDMKQVEGWKFKGARTKIISQVKHFAYNDKDYIVFTSKDKIFILNRKGEVRVKVDTAIAFGTHPNIYFQAPANGGKPYFITDDAAGNVYFIYLNGKVKAKKIASVSATHYFMTEDFDNDGQLELIFADKDFILVYKQNGDPMFAHNFDGEILKPVILKFSKKDKKIAVTDVEKKLVYILNSDGNIYQNFPVNGDTRVTVNPLINKRFSMVVGFNNYLYNYAMF